MCFCRISNIGTECKVCLKCTDRTVLPYFPLIICWILREYAWHAYQHHQYFLTGSEAIWFPWYDAGEINQFQTTMKHTRVRKVCILNGAYLTSTMATPGYVKSAFACGCFVMNDLYRNAIANEENIKCGVVYLNKTNVEDPYMIHGTLKLNFSPGKRQRLNIFLTYDFAWHESSAKSPSNCTIYTMTQTRSLPIPDGAEIRLCTDYQLSYCFSYFFTLTMTISGLMWFLYLHHQEKVGQLYDCSSPIDVILSDVINIS